MGRHALYRLAVVMAVSMAVAAGAGAELIFSSDFSTLPGTVTLTGSAVHTSGYIRLTDNVANQTGTMLLASPGKPLPTISISFAGYIGSSNTTGGLGMCVAYGPIPDGANFGNDHSYGGLKIRFVTGTLNRFQVLYDTSVVANVSVADGTLRYNGLRQFQVTVTADGKCSVYQNGYIRLAGGVIPGWNPPG